MTTCIRNCCLPGFFPRDLLDEILNFIEWVTGFRTYYYCVCFVWTSESLWDATFPDGFEDEIWDLIEYVPNHCLSFYFVYVCRELYALCPFALWFLAYIKCQLTRFMPPKKENKKDNLLYSTIRAYYYSILSHSLKALNFSVILVPVGSRFDRWNWDAAINIG